MRLERNPVYSARSFQLMPDQVVAPLHVLGLRQNRQRRTRILPDVMELIGLPRRGIQCSKALLFCGTGVGISMAANKIKGIRACCCSDSFSCEYTRRHNDANALCMGGRVVGAGLACQLVDLFLATEFEGGRHQRRIDKLTALENR